MSGLCNLGFVDKPTNRLVFVCVAASLATTSCADVESGAHWWVRCLVEMLFETKQEQEYFGGRLVASLHSVGSFFVGFSGHFRQICCTCAGNKLPSASFSYFTWGKHTTSKRWETEGRSTIAAHLTVISVLGRGFLKGQGQGSENIATHSLQVRKCRLIWMCTHIRTMYVCIWLWS